MLVKNVHIHNREGLWQILIEEGKISRIFSQDEVFNYSGEILDGEEGIIYPPFVEPHIHLDATQTAGQPNWNQSGTLFEGIERWAERKSLLSHEDVKSRAWKTLKWQIANGVQYVRTHVDVSDPTLTALKAMLEVKKEIATLGGFTDCCISTRRYFVLSKWRETIRSGYGDGRRCCWRHTSF